jgi:hypothetical protein
MLALIVVGLPYSFKTITLGSRASKENNLERNQLTI